MNRGTNKLAEILTDRMCKEAASPMVLDFASIQGDYSLLTNTFPVPLPKSEYTVCRHLTLGAAGSELGETVESGGHTHKVPVPDKMRSIRPGDRVLVAWVQSEAVVIDIILPAGSL